MTDFFEVNIVQPAPNSISFESGGGKGWKLFYLCKACSTLKLNYTSGWRSSAKPWSVQGMDNDDSFNVVQLLSFYWCDCTWHMTVPSMEYRFKWYQCDFSSFLIKVRQPLLLYCLVKWIKCENNAWIWNSSKSDDDDSSSFPCIFFSKSVQRRPLIVWWKPQSWASGVFSLHYCG